LKLRAILRLVRIFLLALWMGLTLAPAAVRCGWRRDAAVWRAAVGAALARLCERGGPALTKMAQLAAARGDLLPSVLLAPLARVQDRARPPSRRALWRALRDAYGPPAAWPFAIASWEPIGAGSIAAVLEARLPGGEGLALKVVRPGVARRIEADLVWLAWLLRLAGRLPRLRAVPLMLAFDQLAPRVARQSDMFGEALSHARLTPSTGTGLVLPAVRPELTRRGVLAMTLVRAPHRLTDPAVLRPTYERGCRILLAALYRMIFVTGFVHCDLHPGNVGCDGTNVILYDYGLTAELGAADRIVLAGLFTALVNRDPVRACKEILASACSVPPDLDRPVLTADAERLLDRWAGKRAGAFLVAMLVMDLFKLQRRHGLVSAPGFAAAIWALATFEGLVRQRYPELDFQGEAKPFLISSLLGALRGQ
jgi:ubiquinone biosynthesis protein